MSRELLINAAGLRARYRLGTPDSSQLAAALASDATYAISSADACAQIPFTETLLLKKLYEMDTGHPVNRALAIPTSKR